MADSLQPAEGFPRRFGSYVLLSAFAHGGMGEVYLAKHGGIEGIDRLCVLKKLRPDFTQNEEYVRRFIDEARVVVQLNHANICHVFDVGRVGNEYYLAMEYVSGVNLRVLHHRAVEQGRRVPENVALWVVSEMLEALDYAHRHIHPLTGQPLNLVHRDVSPQNVMVNYEGEVKLIDFGLAASDLKEEQTESQVVMGKVAYMSPEQARGERVTPHTDQFAAGIVAYELLVGERFYGEMNNYQIWQVVGRGGFTPPSWTKLPPELQALLSRALHADEKKRYPTCGDFKDALAGYLVTRHPTTSKRTVRALMRELFEDDTRKERSFLSRFADVSAASLRGGSGPEARAVSLLLPSSDGTGALVQAGKAEGDAPKAAAAEPGGRAEAGEATEVVARRLPIETTGTSVLERRVLSSTRRARAMAAAGALVVVGALSGYLGMRALQGPDETKAAVAVSDDAAAGTRADDARPDDTRPDGTRPGDTPPDEVAPALAAATRPDGGALDGARLAGQAPSDGGAPKAVDGASLPPAGEKPPREDEVERPARGKRGKGKVAKKDGKPERRARSGKKIGGAASGDVEKVAKDANAASEAAADPFEETRKWRKTALRELGNCDVKCSGMLRESLAELPIEKINGYIRRSVGSCLEQCAAAAKE